MWILLFLLMRLQAPSTLDYGVFKTKVQPLLTEKRPGHARCITCHSTGTGFRLQRLSEGATTWNEEQSQKNFESAKRMVNACVTGSRPKKQAGMRCSKTPRCRR